MVTEIIKPPYLAPQLTKGENERKRSYLSSKRLNLILGLVILLDWVRLELMNKYLNQFAFYLWIPNNIFSNIQERLIMLPN